MDPFLLFPVVKIAFTRDLYVYNFIPSTLYKEKLEVSQDKSIRQEAS